MKSINLSAFTFCPTWFIKRFTSFQMIHFHMFFFFSCWFHVRFESVRFLHTWLLLTRFGYHVASFNKLVTWCPTCSFKLTFTWPPSHPITAREFFSNQSAFNPSKLRHNSLYLQSKSLKYFENDILFIIRTECIFTWTNSVKHPEHST